MSKPGLSSDPFVDVRDIEPHHLLRFARTDHELALDNEVAERAESLREAEAVWLDASDGDVPRPPVELDAPTATAAALGSGGSVFQLSGDGENELGAGDLATALAGGSSLSALRAEQWLPGLAQWSDRLVLASACEVSMTVVVRASSGPVEITDADQAVVLALAGVASIDDTTITPDCAGVRRRLTGRSTTRLSVEVDPRMDPHPALALVVSMRRRGIRDFVDALRSRAGYEPLFRADLPLEQGATATSYGGSLWDSEDAFERALEPLIDEVASEGAEARWSAQLRPATPPALADAPARRLADRLVARPTFLDERLPLPDGITALAAAGILVLANPTGFEELVEGRPAPTAEAARELANRGLGGPPDAARAEAER